MAGLQPFIVFILDSSFLFVIIDFIVWTANSQSKHRIDWYTYYITLQHVSCRHYCNTCNGKITPGSLTSGFLWNRWPGKCSGHSWRMRNPQFYASVKRPITLKRKLRKTLSLYPVETWILRGRSPIPQLSFSHKVKQPRYCLCKMSWPLHSAADKFNNHRLSFGRWNMYMNIVVRPFIQLRLFYWMVAKLKGTKLWEITMYVKFRTLFHIIRVQCPLRSYICRKWVATTHRNG